MRCCYWKIPFFVLTCMIGTIDASAGDIDPSYRACLGECFPPCKLFPEDSPWYFPRSLYQKWKLLDCKHDCMYQCMTEREKERATLGQIPVKYHGKWPFKRVFGLQEAASVALSLLNLAMHFHGLSSFYTLVKHKKAYYDYAGLWYIYGLLSMNSWFWSALFHTRDVDITEKLDYSCAVALLGYSLILAILRSFNVRKEAARVMVSAPILAFVTTHILYLNNYRMDYGWNMAVCVSMGVAQLVVWTVWAGATGHPCRIKVWLVVVGGGLAMLLEIFDFPPYKGIVDAHAVWHASTVPLTYVWWSFVRDDATFVASARLKKAK